MFKTVSAAMFMFVFALVSSAGAQALPHDEQQFCDASQKFRQAPEQAGGNNSGRPMDQRRKSKRAASLAAKDFQRVAGWRNASMSVKGWSGELYMITESTAWGHYVGASVKLPCGNVIIGVPEYAVRR